MSRTHGMSNTKIYNVWKAMKRRCYLKSDKRFRNYGGRGIVVCDEWKESFETFYRWSIENGYQENKGLSIDRIDVNKNYEPNNCRWVTNDVQMNNMTNNRLIEYKGQTKTLSQWSKELGVPYPTLQARIFSYGWSVERALTTPHYKDNKRGIASGAGVGEEEKRFIAYFSMKQPDGSMIKLKKTYSKNKYGEGEAKKMAIKQRKEWEDTYWNDNN